MRILSSLLASATLALCLPWPHYPQDQPHPIGNAWGNYQNYGSAYCHNGQDIMTGPLVPVLAIKHGYVKAIFLGGSPMYNGVTVADSAGSAFCSGYMYYHIDNSTIVVQEGDTVEVGDTLGQIAYWSTAGFHHDHFSKNRRSGVTWPDYGSFYKNPLMDLAPDDDSITPNFLNAYTGQRFAICRNNTSTYLTKDSVYGNVDLICRLDDRINHRLWKVAVFKLQLGVRDTFSNWVVPEQVTIQMTDSIDGYSAQQSRVVYKQDATCRTQCNYDSLARAYYYIITNTDYDSLIESTDSLAGWNTAVHPDGDYWVVITAWDEHGNTARDSMMVRLRNGLSNRHDVGVTAIKSPGAMSDSGSTVVPACSVYNYGTYTESYQVRMQVGSVYDQLASVTSHAPGTARYVLFPDWVVNCAPGSYALTCSTRLAADTNRANDRRTGSTLVAVHDVGATAILAPTGVVDSGVPVIPSARVENFGSVDETFLVEFSISDGYARTLTRTVPAGTDTLVQFAAWTPETCGFWVTRCTTRLASDVRHANDKVEDSVVVAPPQGVAEGTTGPQVNAVLPNPVRGQGTVRYTIAVSGHVAVALYDAAGRLAATLADGFRAAGTQTARLRAGRLAPGVYWLRVETASTRSVRKVVVAGQ